MLKVKLTENYTGVTISGDYQDLDNLYNSIYYLIYSKEDKNIGEYLLRNHLYAFLYDVRHAYQGDREVKLVDNWLSSFKRNCHDLKKKDITNKNIYYEFNYLLPDLLLDMIIIKYFINNVNKKDNNIYNPSINIVNYFYSLCLESIKTMLTPIRFNKVKKGIMNASIWSYIYLPQWFEIISIEYSWLSKEKREKQFIHYMDKIYNFLKYKDYYKLKEEIELYCKENNCTLDGVHYEGYPEELEW